MEKRSSVCAGEICATRDDDSYDNKRYSPLAESSFHGGLWEDSEENKSVTQLILQRLLTEERGLKRLHECFFCSEQIMKLAMISSIIELNYFERDYCG